jgi:hypothetical protein
MKKITLSLSILTALLFASVVFAHTADNPFTTDLIAGQNTDVGDVEVWNDENNLYIEYITVGDWEITETHLYVGKTDPNTLTTAPGQFPYSSDNPYVIPLNEIAAYEMKVNKKGKQTGKLVVDESEAVGVECEDIIYIAAHAVVEREECTTYKETAWGEGTDFDQKNWAMYFAYTIQCPPEIVKFPEEGNAYIGYEDWTNGDFDYNDFGMTMAVEEWYENDVLADIYMTFEAVIYDSGADHYINITRSGLAGNYEYDVLRSGAAYTGEKDTGSYTGSGDFDVALFNTSKYAWPSKQIGETVEIHIYNFDTNNSMPSGLTPPRDYNVGSGDFYDLDSLFDIYDPWMDPFAPGWISPYEWHIEDTQVITNISNQKNYPAGEAVPVGTEVPMILVVPETDWVPPYEDTTITGPYGYFNDFYTTGAPANWYETITNSTVGYGGLSW